VPLLAPLSPDERTTFLVVSLPKKVLSKLAGSLGTAPRGTRIDTLSEWDLAWSLVDYYAEDAEVAEAIDRTLRKEIGPSPLAGAVAAAGGSAAVTELVLASRDPARDLAWALLDSGVEGAGELAARCVQTIIAEYDEADRRARERDEAEAETVPTAPSPADESAREAEKEAARARSERDRALKRVGGLKERLVELEQAVATARRELRTAEEGRTRLEAERGRVVEERDGLRAQLRTGTPAEVTRLREELEVSARRVRQLETELEEARDAEETSGARLRQLEEERAARPVAEGAAAEAERAPGGGPGWAMPIFTGEFYDSIRRWDRRIVRTAFEKINRLAEDWRHPSLRAIPLEGLPDYFRIRVATDVRLIYRPLDGNRIEILSLIDREDLQRYVRQAKSR